MRHRRVLGSSQRGGTKSGTRIGPAVDERKFPATFGGVGFVRSRSSCPLDRRAASGQLPLDPEVLVGISFACCSALGAVDASDQVRSATGGQS